MAIYHRILLKLSGEALKSENDLFDFDKINQVADIIRRIRDMGVEVGIVIGAGNIWRGRQGPSACMDAVIADQMGMLGTAINCLCVSDALRRAGVDAVVQSSVDMNRGVALRAIEMQVDAVLMAKNVDGVYTADPAKDPSAVLIQDITYAEALARGLKVMDASAFALCAENKVPMVRVFGLDDPENLIRVLEGDPMGTFVHP